MNICDEKICLVDMDGTIADYTGAMQRSMSEIGYAPDSYELHSDENPPHIEAAMNLIRSQDAWWRELPKLAVGFNVMQEAIRVGFHPMVLTQGPRRAATAWSQKYEWCNEHLGPDVDVVITRNKAGQYGRVLVDDYPPYMVNWLAARKRGLGIMPLNKQNADFEHPRVIKYHPDSAQATLGVVRKALQIAFDRKSGEELCLNLQ